MLALSLAWSTSLPCFHSFQTQSSVGSPWLRTWEALPLSQRFKMRKKKTSFRLMITIIKQPIGWLNHQRSSFHLSSKTHLSWTTFAHQTGETTDLETISQSPLRCSHSWCSLAMESLEHSSSNQIQPSVEQVLSMLAQACLDILAWEDNHSPCCQESILSQSSWLSWASLPCSQEVACLYHSCLSPWCIFSTPCREPHRRSQHLLSQTSRIRAQQESRLAQ